MYKKGDKLELNNYRGITLLNTGLKIVSKILYERLQPHMENVVSKYQCGFRRGKSAINQTQPIKQMLEKTSEYAVCRFHLSVDFKAACDTTRRDNSLEALKEFKIPQRVIKLVELTLKHVRCRVKIHNNVSEQYEVSVGFRQGDDLSCILFNLALEKVIRVS
jgi:Reverse transcriptase (RNA-dependent DNA polymerase).